MKGRGRSVLKEKVIQAHLGDIMGFIPDHCNKANIAIKRVTRMFWFPSQKVMFTLYCSLLSVQ